MLRSRINKTNSRGGLSGGKPPLYSSLLFYSKERDDETVIDKIAGNDAELVGKKYVNHAGTIYSIVSENNAVCDYIEVDVNFNNVTDSQVILGGMNFNGVNCHLLFGALPSDTSKKRIGLGSKDSTHSFWIYDFELSADNWYNIKIYVESSIVKVTINDVEQTIDDGSNRWVWYEGFTIGIRSGSTYGIFNGKISNVTLKNNNVSIYDFPYTEGEGCYITDRVNGVRAELINCTGSDWGTDLSDMPKSAVIGMSKIDGYDGEIPPLLSNPAVDCITKTSPLTNPATSKIVSNVDGYIEMPSNVTIEIDEEQFPIFNKTSIIYNADGLGVPNPTGSEYYVSSNPYLWHLEELNTETITNYLTDDYKFLWFVKNTFETGTYNPLTIKEIFAYNEPITNVEILNKIKSYIGYDWEIN